MIEFAVAGTGDPIPAAVPWLSLSILVPIVGALLVPLVPDAGDGKKVRWYALIVTLITFLITVAAYLTGYDPSLSGLQLSERVDWLPDLGLTWAVGADGLSMPLILLTSFITTLACLAAWPVSFKPRLFYFLLLAMDGGQIAVFAVQDMLLFFLAWELELIPVYLLPAIFLFGIGNTGAAMAIIIYAMPPVVRLTNLGIRQVPQTSVEVAQSFGSTRLQTMAKVQIPQAMPSIVLGINQTIMMALGLAVLAAFIGTGGLGREVYKALFKLKVGWAFEAGMCIVFMAIIFDRLTLAIGAPKDSEALADRTQLRVVLQNLLSNAVKYTDEGGVRLRVSKLEQEAFFRFEVQDTGVGIEPDNLIRIFDPFYTTRAAGTGLGLAVVAMTVNQHGGDISARNHPTGGAEFLISLPMLAPGE